MPSRGLPEAFQMKRLWTPEGFAKIVAASPGTIARNKTLKADDLMAIEVPVPPLAKQQAFATLCQKFARLRAAQESRATALAALIPSLSTGLSKVGCKSMNFNKLRFFQAVA